MKLLYFLKIVNMLPIKNNVYIFEPIFNHKTIANMKLSVFSKLLNKQRFIFIKYISTVFLIPEVTILI